MRLKSHTDLPVAVGFGIKTPERQRRLHGATAVVGSAIVDRVLEGIDADGKLGPETAHNVLSFVSNSRLSSWRMSWLTNFVRPIRALVQRKDVPENPGRNVPVAVR